MKTEVAILHHEYPSDVREYVEARLQQLVKYYERTLSVRALLEKQHDDHRIELIANVRRGVVLKVDSRGDSFRSTLDDAIHRMARVLSRHKEKVYERSRHRVRVTETLREPESIPEQDSILEDESIREPRSI